MYLILYIQVFCFMSYSLLNFSFHCLSSRGLIQWSGAYNKYYIFDVFATSDTAKCFHFGTFCNLCAFFFFLQKLLNFFAQLHCNFIRKCSSVVFFYFYFYYRRLLNTLFNSQIFYLGWESVDTLGNLLLVVSWK